MACVPGKAADGPAGRSRRAGRRWPVAAVWALLPAALGGCAYTVNTGIPSNIKTVAIPTFGNSTVQYTLGQELTDAVIDRFVRDNHLKVVPQRDAQSVVSGTVLEYRNEVFGYTAAEQAQEYRVGVRVEVRFKDLVKNKDVWSDVVIKTVNYSTVPVGGRPAGTEEQGRHDLVAQVADEILSPDSVPVVKPAGKASRPGAAPPAGGARAREISRAALEAAASAGPLPRVIALVGGDPLLAAEIAAGLAEGASPPGGFGGFDHETLYAHEIKLRDLSSRIEELPLLAGERVLILKGAQALLKQDAADLVRVWPPPGAATLLILIAEEEEPRTGRKGPPAWLEVLPAHAVRVSVGAPTPEDAARWGRQSASAAGVELPETVWVSAHRRSGGDGARLRTDIELAVLGALCGRPAGVASGPRDPGLEESTEQLRGLLLEGDWKNVWPAAGRYRSLGGSMDARGAEWVRWVAEQFHRGERPETVAALRALSTLQLRWRREIGTARQVLERNALELTVTRLRRRDRKGAS